MFCFTCSIFEGASIRADYGVDAYSAACLKYSPYAVPCARPGGFPSSQVILRLAHTIEHEENRDQTVGYMLTYCRWTVGEIV
ncbi:homeobox-leucine zipper protein REVOLUTA [Trifolium repens]|nr:homeobox-leucine zipper protein REVOLUTA [Trifolium repens]